MNIYEGRENYIFVSYAHADKDKVIPILEALDKANFRIWYDSGIEAGSEWPAYISDHVKTCHRMIFFASEKSVASKNCRNEVNLALSKNKEILVVYLEDVELANGLDLQLATNQAIFKNNYASEKMFFDVITRANILLSCKRAAASTVEDGDDESKRKKGHSTGSESAGGGVRPAEPFPWFDDDTRKKIKRERLRRRRLRKKYKRYPIYDWKMFCRQNVVVISVILAVLAIAIGISVFSWNIGQWIIGSLVALAVIAGAIFIDDVDGLVRLIVCGAATVLNIILALIFPDQFSNMAIVVSIGTAVSLFITAFISDDEARGVIISLMIELNIAMILVSNGGLREPLVYFWYFAIIVLVSVLIGFLVEYIEYMPIVSLITVCGVLVVHFLLVWIMPHGLHAMHGFPELLEKNYDSNRATCYCGETIELGSFWSGFVHTNTCESAKQIKDIFNLDNCQYNENQHMFVCNCGMELIDAPLDHKFEDGVCSVCGYKSGDPIPPQNKITD